MRTKEFYEIINGLLNSDSRKATDRKRMSKRLKIITKVNVRIVNVQLSLLLHQFPCFTTHVLLLPTPCKVILFQILALKYSQHEKYIKYNLRLKYVRCTEHAVYLIVRLNLCVMSESRCLRCYYAKTYINVKLGLCHVILHILFIIIIIIPVVKH